MAKHFSSTIERKLPKQRAVRACVIFNPTARGEKARLFRRYLEQIGSGCTLKLTAAAGDGRRLAAEAVREGFDTVVAAGGDGTLNEVLNGLGDAPDGFQKARLGLLPLGTVNVFARELGIPLRLDLAWNTILSGKETRVDLPCATFSDGNGSTLRRYFAQLAGAGLDARAIELVEWQVKKKVGPLAYVLAGMKALGRPATSITITTDKESETGELVLIGNGQLYGGKFRLFPGANPRDGLLEVRVFPRANWWTLISCAPGLLLLGKLRGGAARFLRCTSFKLESPEPTPMEVDGELAGWLPANFTLQREALRVLVPG